MYIYIYVYVYVHTHTPHTHTLSALLSVVHVKTLLCVCTSVFVFGCFFCACLYMLYRYDMDPCSDKCCSSLSVRVCVCLYMSVRVCLQVCVCVCVYFYKRSNAVSTQAIKLTHKLLYFFFFVGCLMSQQHASVSQGLICSDNFMCCHTEIEVANQTFQLTQSQYTDTGRPVPALTL